MSDKQHVKDAINSLYEGVGIRAKYSWPVNEEVARVFGELLLEIHSCTSALTWVPTPSGGPASIKWVVKNISRSVMQQFKDDVSLSCAKARILQFQSPLRLAAMGL